MKQEEQGGESKMARDITVTISASIYRLERKDTITILAALEKWGKTH